MSDSSEPPVLPKEFTEGNSQTGIEGIDYFKQFDDFFHTFDTGKRSEVGTVTVQFNPDSGSLYYLKTKADGQKKFRAGVGFNLRTGEYYSLNERDSNPKDDERIQQAISIVSRGMGNEYMEWLEKPPGHF